MTRGALTAALIATAACRGAPASESDPPAPLIAVSFNTGTTEAMGNAGPDDGYGPEQAAISDQWYGDGLAWRDVVDDATAFFAATRPDVVGFQEIFWSGDCAGIPLEAASGFVCEDWSDGDPTVAQQILGPDYQVACHMGKSDKCLAVRTAFGTIAGCDGDLCLDFLDGAEVDGCGSGSRIGRAVVALADGGALTVVNVHGTSGIAPEDQDCRVAQLALVFDDLGDGEPAANGARNLVLGDFNTDPGRNAGFDPSAAALYAAGTTGPFHFVSDVGPEAVPSYGGLLNIDHALSDALDGTCHSVGAGGTDPVSPIVYLDHQPLVCELTETP